MWSRVFAGPALLCLLAACSTPAAPASPLAGFTAPAVVAGTDMAWAQLTIALNDRALQVLHLVPDRAADARLVTLAGELAAGHTDENVQLHAFLDRIGAPVENPHSGHEMPGMATAGELTSMSAARGAAFDQLFVSSLRKHLTQCHSLAGSMRRAGRLPDALALAAAIESTRRQALSRLAPWP